MMEHPLSDLTKSLQVGMYIDTAACLHERYLGYLESREGIVLSCIVVKKTNKHAGRSREVTLRFHCWGCSVVIWRRRGSNVTENTG